MTYNRATYAEIVALGNGDFGAGLRRWLAGERLPAGPVGESNATK